MSSALLPPNATELERLIAEAAEQFGNISVSVVADLYNADQCPLHLLPFLAYAEQLDDWDSNWPENVQRSVIKQARLNRRIKGTRAAVEAAVAAIGGTINIIEWWAKTPQGDPHTFEVVITGGQSYQQADLQAAMIRAIDNAKPARAHYTLGVGVEFNGDVGIVGNALVANYRRLQLAGNY